MHNCLLNAPYKYLNHLQKTSLMLHHWLFEWQLER